LSFSRLRGDEPVESRDHPPLDLVGAADAVDSREDSGALVVVEEGPGAGVIDLQAMAHRLFGIVLALVEFTAAFVAHAVGAGRLGRDIVHRLALAAGPATGDAPD